MRLVEGDNHLISERDGIVICQVWTRPDLSAEAGAKSAQQMTSYMMNVVLRPGTPYRGIIFDVRRGPTVFGPKTRETLTRMLSESSKLGVRVAFLSGESASQALQFRGLCATVPSVAQVFENEPAAAQWLRTQPSRP
jgi:hypothetical protein